MPDEHRKEHPVMLWATVIAAATGVIALYSGGNDAPSTTSPPARSSTAAPPPTRSETGVRPTAETRAPESATVRHQGKLTIAPGGTRLTSHDLDSPASDPQWQTGRADISYQSSERGQNLYRSGESVLVLGDTPADYHTCRDTTGYSTAYQIRDIEPGAYLCWKTDEKRYVALRIREQSPDSITLEVVSYDPPDE